MKARAVIAPVFVAAIACAVLYFGVVSKPSTPQTPAQKYVAIGDSVAAGLGLNGGKSSDVCGRSAKAYPYVVASQLQMGVRHLACSGATMNEGVLGPQNGIAPQIDSIFTGAEPTLITATIGANDLGWTKILAKCYQATCGTTSDTALANTNLSALNDNLHELLDRIQSHNPQAPPRVVLTSYYQVLPPNKKGCPRVDSLQETEFSWWREQENKLNKTIASAARDYLFARYAPVDFSGHDICEFGDSSWIQGLADQAPFHPTDIGQAVIAGAVLTANGTFRK